MLLNIFKTYLYAFNSETNETNLANGVYVIPIHCINNKLYKSIAIL